MANGQPERHKRPGDDATCPLFRLPLELRIKIWSLAAFERQVRITTIVAPGEPYKPWPWNAGQSLDIVCVRAYESAPAIMQVCQEARRLAPYIKAFTVGTNPRYTWINFEKDMIHISHYDIMEPALEPHLDEIQRLKLKVGGQHIYELVVQHGNSDFKHYPALREIHLLDYDIGRLYWARETSWGDCPMQNVRIIDAFTGLVLTLEQMDMMEDFRWYHGFARVGSTINKCSDRDRDEDSDEHFQEQPDEHDWPGWGFSGAPWALDDAGIPLLSDLREIG